MIKAVYIILTILLVLVLIGRFFYNKAMILETHKSPDGNYELVIKSNRIPFSSTMPGDGGLGSTPIEVVLKDKNGKIIGTSNSIRQGEVFYDSLNIEWDFENNEVWYAKARTINLTTGKVEY